jgi:predicted phage terminase large subunit-like protein
MTIEEQEILAVYKTLVESSLENFTRYFFLKNRKTKYILGEHHKLICQTLDDVIAGKTKRLIINIAPRYGKTTLAVHNFIAYCLALNPSGKFIHLSYSSELALDNSESIKDIVKSDAYQQMFPLVQIKPGTDAKHRWDTTTNGGVYATSFGGQITGFGAGSVEAETDEEMNDFLIGGNDPNNFSGCIVIDDPGKPADMESPVLRDKINKKFDSTIRNRVNSRNTPIIIIAQRLHTEDLCGYLLNNEPGEWTVLDLPCIKNYGTPQASALWPHLHSLEELLKMEVHNPINFARQYMQRADTIAGRLYKSFKTYSEPPRYLPIIKCVIDSADQGTDFLCSIVYCPKSEGFYVLDVIYTQASAEITEAKVAHQLKSFQVEEVRIESNSGGRSFSRNVERISRETSNWRTKFTSFHQSKNKESRILSQSSEVSNMIVFPEDWKVKWPQFYNAVTNFQSDFTSAHDDAVDCLTMIVETERLGTYKIHYIIPTSSDTRLSGDRHLKWVKGIGPVMD